MATTNESLAVLKGLLSGGTVSYQAVFSKAFRSIPIGVYLSQMYFWQENSRFKSEKTHQLIGGKMYITRTAADFFDETGLTVEQQIKAREVLREHGVLGEKKIGVPPKMWQHIDLEILVSVINRYLETGSPVSVDHRSKERYITRTRNGKFRSTETVINRNTYIESLESGKESEKESIGETPFLIQTVEVTDDNLKIETVEVFDFTPEENETQKKSSKGRGAAKKPGEYTNQDVARNLEIKHQVFFTEVIQSGAWPDFLEYRKTRDGRIPYRDPKSQAIGVRQFYEACGGKSEIAQAVVDQSRGNGWMGLFPLKQQKNATNNAPNAPIVQRQHQGIATYLNSGGYSPFDFTADARPLANN